MTTISAYFQTLRDRQQCALIPFITAGDPDLETTAEALGILDRNGADFIELGVPYSDPLADGPVIQAAATRAQLQNRVKHLITDLRTVTDKPIGVGFGISDAAQAHQVMEWGADAVIVGSAFVKRLAEGSPTAGLQAVEQFCRELKAAITVVSLQQVGSTK